MVGWMMSIGSVEAEWSSKPTFIIPSSPISVGIEIPAAIRNFYNDFVACRYRDVNAFTEEYRQWVHASGPFDKGSEELRAIYWLRNMPRLRTVKKSAGGCKEYRGRGLCPEKRLSFATLRVSFGPSATSLNPATREWRHRLRSPPGTLTRRRGLSYVLLMARKSARCISTRNHGATLRSHRANSSPTEN